MYLAKSGGVSPTGSGVWTSKRIRQSKGSERLICVYTGREVTRKEAQDLDTTYLQESSEGFLIDGSSRTSFANLLAHDFDPSEVNCKAGWNPEQQKLLVYALKKSGRGGAHRAYRLSSLV